jgi:hypothetical protein
MCDRDVATNPWDPESVLALQREITAGRRDREAKEEKIALQGQIEHLTQLVQQEHKEYEDLANAVGWENFSLRETQWEQEKRKRNTGYDFYT